MWLSPIPQETLSIEAQTSSQNGGENGFWSEFPEDLIFEVMSRLSLNDLFALKSVSKDWNFMISNMCIPRLCPPFPCVPCWGFLCFIDPLPPPEEGEDHITNDPRYEEDKFLKFYFRRYYRPMYAREYFPPRILGDKLEECFLSLLPEEAEVPDPSDIRDCCNGLLLLTSSKNSRYFVANPATNQRLLVPKNSHHRNKTNIRSIHSSLVFDPSISLGFKIVSCVRPAEDATVTHPMELDIFCSEAGEWSSHVLPLEPHELYGFEWLRRSIYFNGALYSLSLAMYLVCIDNLILRPSRNTSSSMGKDVGGFNVKAWAIELPDKHAIPSELLPNCYGCIGVSLGCFYYANRDAEGSFMFVWMLVQKGKNSEWVRIHTISIADDLVSTLPNPSHVRHWKKFDCFRPRVFFPHRDIIIIAAPKLAIFYHLKTKWVDEFWIPPKPLRCCNRKTLQMDGNWMFPFSPCLLLLNSIAAEKVGE